MAIAALLRFTGSHGVRDKSGKRLPGKSRRRDCLLRVIEPLAIGVLRTDENRARRARGCDAVPSNGAIDPEHVKVIAQNLEVVARVISREQAFIVQHRTAGVGGHLQMTAKTSWHPRGVAGVASHFVVGVSERSIVRGRLRRNGPVFGHQLGP